MVATRCRDSCDARLHTALVHRYPLPRALFQRVCFQTHLDSNILQTGVLVRRKNGAGSETHFKNEPAHHLLLVNMLLACNQLCLVCFSQRQIGFGMKSQYRLRPPSSNCIRKKSRHYPTTSHKFVQWVTIELRVRTSRKQLGLVQFFRTRPRCNADGRSVAPSCK